MIMLLIAALVGMVSWAFEIGAVACLKKGKVEAGIALNYCGWLFALMAIGFIITAVLTPSLSIDLMGVNIGLVRVAVTLFISLTGGLGGYVLGVIIAAIKHREQFDDRRNNPVEYL